MKYKGETRFSIRTMRIISRRTVATIISIVIVGTTMMSNLVYADMNDYSRETIATSSVLTHLPSGVRDYYSTAESVIPIEKGNIYYFDNDLYKSKVIERYLDDNTTELTIEEDGNKTIIVVNSSDNTCTINGDRLQVVDTFYSREESNTKVESGNNDIILKSAQVRYRNATAPRWGTVANYKTKGEIKKSNIFFDASIASLGYTAFFTALGVGCPVVAAVASIGSALYNIYAAAKVKKISYTDTLYYHNSYTSGWHNGSYCVMHKVVWYKTIDQSGKSVKTTTS
ncbi:hypothetical protein [Aminicella lysinilytica]|uniref:hypothetical protein n=1 Tax=Aminicella lysinilytica TaxID=433323 RepID=UPI0026EB51B7|nr:hypothetical protein [Aminicella lysinilytica]